MFVRIWLKIIVCLLFGFIMLFDSLVKKVMGCCWVVKVIIKIIVVKLIDIFIVNNICIIFEKKNDFVFVIWLEIIILLEKGWY